MKNLLPFVLTVLIASCGSGGPNPTDPAPKDSVAGISHVDTAADNMVLEKAMQRERYREDSLFYSGRAVTVKRLSGKEKYGGKTRISFKPLVEVIAEERAYGKSHMEPVAETDRTIKAYIEEAIGGELRLDVTRGTIGAADLESFTIVIQDSTDAEVFRKALASDIPEVGEDDWWNVHLQMLPVSIRPPFYVYVVDQLADEPIKFGVYVK